METDNGGNDFNAMSWRVYKAHEKRRRQICEERGRKLAVDQAVQKICTLIEEMMTALIAQEAYLEGVDLYGGEELVGYRLRIVELGDRAREKIGSCGIELYALYDSGMSCEQHGLRIARCPEITGSRDVIPEGLLPHVRYALQSKLEQNRFMVSLGSTYHNRSQLDQQCHRVFVSNLNLGDNALCEYNFFFPHNYWSDDETEQ